MISNQTYLLKFEAKIVPFEPLVSLCSFNSIQISVNAKLLKSKKNYWRRIEVLLKKKTYLHQKFWLIYREFRSAKWPNFTVVKSNLISNIYHNLKFRKSIKNRCSIKKLLLKNLAIFTGKHLPWGLFFNENSGL